MIVKKTRGNQEIELTSRAINDLRYLHEQVNHTFDTIRNRALALFAGEITIITFFFTSGDFSFIQGSTAIPAASWIFFAIGLGLLTWSLLCILWILHPVGVTTPPDTKDTRNMVERFDNSEAKYLRYTKAEFEDAIDRLVDAINKRAHAFAWVVRLLPIAVLIMVVLKYL